MCPTEMKKWKVSEGVGCFRPNTDIVGSLEEFSFSRRKSQQSKWEELCVSKEPSPLLRQKSKLQ